MDAQKEYEEAFKCPPPSRGCKAKDVDWIRGQTKRLGYALIEYNELLGAPFKIAPGEHYVLKSIESAIAKENKRRLKLMNKQQQQRSPQQRQQQAPAIVTGSVCNLLLCV